MKNYSITAIIVNYNNNFLLKSCINSVLNQSHPVDQIIIVDDCSKNNDEIKNLIEAFDLNNIKLIINEINVGPGKSRNIAWDYVTTEFIAFLDSDDLWHEETIATQLEYFKKFKNYSVICGEKSNYTEQNTKYEIKNLNKNYLLFFNTIATSSVMLRANIKQRFRNTYYAEDYYLWLNILFNKLEIGFINQYLSYENNSLNIKNKLSNHPIKMELYIQSNFLKFYDSNILNCLTIFFAQFFSILKFLFRIFRNTL